MSDCAIPDSIWPEPIMRRFSTEPCVAWATATRSGTPQLPPRSQGWEPAGFDIALAITPPISKKVPEVEAAPMRKNFASCAPAERAPQRRLRTTAAAAHGPHQRTSNMEDIVSPGETAISENNTDRFGLQHRVASKQSPGRHAHERRSGDAAGEQGGTAVRTMPMIA